ncbi:MAG: hypothetical protein IIC39_05490 [Candidatus Marinimicrobia bacterium]|nr:hypothetical protein [Candidatus Neomarinimicrobiota bacterium]
MMYSLKILVLTLLPLTSLIAQEEQKAKPYIGNGIIIKSLTEKTTRKASVEKFQLHEKHIDEIAYIKERLGKIHEVQIIMVKDVKYRGNLLYTSDSSLVICEGNGCYDWRNESFQSISYSDIKKIVVIREGKGRKGFKWGSAVGAVLAVVGIITSDECESEPSGSYECFDIVKVLVTIGGGIEGAILGGIIGVVFGIDTNYHIDESINQFQSALPKLKKEAIFPSNPASVLEIQ